MIEKHLKNFVRVISKSGFDYEGYLYINDGYVTLRKGETYVDLMTDQIESITYKGD